MSISAIGGLRVELDTKQAVGAGVGLATTTAIAATTMRGGLDFPLPVGLIAGAAIGGPIAAVSLMNGTGEPNKAWQSLAVGAAPLAVIGGALGAITPMFESGGAKAMIGSGMLGALTFGAVGAAIGGIAHWATKPD